MCYNGRDGYELRALRFRQFVLAVLLWGKEVGGGGGFTHLFLASLTLCRVSSRSIGLASNTQLRMYIIKKVTFKEGYLMW